MTLINTPLALFGIGSILVMAAILFLSYRWFTDMKADDQTDESMHHEDAATSSDMQNNIVSAPFWN